MSSVDVSMAVVRRLPRYYRFLTGLARSGVNRISSSEIANQMGLTASQIRQDLNNFGGFGLQGYGYNVPQLISEIENILSLNSSLKAILIGVGNLGKAIAGFILSSSKGINLIGLFDKNHSAISPVEHLEVMSSASLSEFCITNEPEIAILCIPGRSAQRTAEQLKELGIKGFWNFSDSDLHMGEGVYVENVHLGDSLMTLGFQVHSFFKNDR
ncbi:MAG: redox-sensing transcriptional repressor Rex [Ruminococcaceae bacterium]|nr:redox-sensing transcriptional repressor Rex [Oscillospiraceae bacterium]